MQRLRELLPELPALVAAGLLDVTGGALALRSGKGLYLTPEGAGFQLGWKLTEDDFVLFPGGGEASMAKAGRLPDRNNRLHRAALAAFPKWNYTIESTLPGLLARSISCRDLQLGQAHAAAFLRNRSISIRLARLESEAGSDSEQLAIELIKGEFRNGEFGAVLIEGSGVFAGATQLSLLQRGLLVLEKSAQAQCWQLGAG